MDAHSWNVTRILVMIWPDAPREAICYAIFHDVGEVGPGDAPYPSKAHNPVLRDEVNRLEAETVASMGLLHHLELEDHWQHRVKLCDCMEMWEFGLDEVAMGNTFGQAIVNRMEEAVNTLAWTHLTQEERERIGEYRIWRITKQP